MTPEIKSLIHYISVLAVLGWLADTCARIALHSGWWALIPAFNTVAILVLVIILHQEIRGA